MAGAGYKLFNTGDVLTAAQVNTYLNEQTVMVFANSTARTTALSGVLAEGMVSYLQDTNAVEVYNGSAWVGVSGAGDVTEVQAGTGISVASGTGPIPVVTNTMATAVDAKGDLIVGTGADTFARLAVGTNGHTLVADSVETTGLKWAAPASGGMTVITSGTLSGSSVVLSSIPSTYNNLNLVIRNFRPATDDTAIFIRINNDATGSRYATQTYQSASETNVSFISSGFTISGQSDDGASNSLINVDFYDYTNATTWKLFDCVAITNNPTTATNFDIRKVFGLYNQTPAITRIDLIGSGTNFTSGDYILYGVK